MISDVGLDSFRNLTWHDTILGDTLKAVSRQDADQPALSADAFKGLDRLKERETADSAAGMAGANPASQVLEAGNKYRIKNNWYHFHWKPLQHIIC